MPSVFNRFDNFVADVSNLLRANSPKRSREETGTAANPFGPEESEWLTNALDTSLKQFGKACDSRFKANEAEIFVFEESLQLWKLRL